MGKLARALLLIPLLAGCGADQGPPGVDDLPGLGCLGALQFSAPLQIATGAGPWYALDGDYNLDGHPDLAVINAGSLDGAGGLFLLLNNTAAPGDATSFAVPAAFATGPSPQGLGGADFNGDGREDLAVGNYFSSGVPGAPGPALLGPTADALSIFINQTPPGADTAQFAPKVDYRAGPGVGFVYPADFNGDGLIDIAVTNFNTPGAGGVSVLLNRTARGAAQPDFAEAVRFDVGTAPIGLQGKDLNADGKPDLVVGNSLGFTVSVLLNTTPDGAAAPGFANAVDFPVGSEGDGPESLDVEDLNGDGRPDIVSPHFFTVGPGLVSVLVNTTPPRATTPSFAEQLTFSAGLLPEQVVLEDVDGDARRDIVVANFGDVGVTGAGVSVLLNRTPPGSDHIEFAAQQSYAAGSGPASVAVADFNGDRKRDLAVANMLSPGAAGLSVLSNEGCGERP